MPEQPAPRLVTVADSGEPWKADFAQEARRIRRALGQWISLDHIGSTALPGCRAKPILDLLGQVPRISRVDDEAEHLEALGYEAMGEFGIPGRRYFRKQNADGDRSHHLHVFQSKSPDAVRHLAFRDYLRAHRSRARAYADLKARLVAEPGATWDSYIDGKDSFVKQTEQDALNWARAQP